MKSAWDIDDWGWNEDYDTKNKCGFIGQVQVSRVGMPVSGIK